MSSVKVTNIAHPSATGNNIVLDSGGGATFSQIKGGAITSGTSVASTSGTSIDFTGIPSWVKRITVMFSGVSLTNFNSEANSILVQLGDSGGIENSSYTQSSSYISASNGIYVRSDGFHIATWNAAGNTVQGAMQIFNHNGNLWCTSGIVYHSAGFTTITAGSKTLSGTLDRVRITTVNGTDTFDAGTINILYEG